MMILITKIIASQDFRNTIITYFEQYPLVLLTLFNPIHKLMADYVESHRTQCHRIE